MIAKCEIPGPFHPRPKKTPCAVTDDKGPNGAVEGLPIPNYGYISVLVHVASPVRSRAASRQRSLTGVV